VKLLRQLQANGIETLEDLIAVLEQSYDGIILSDHSGRIFFANDRAIQRLANMNAGSIIGLTSQDLIDRGIILEETKTVISYKNNRSAILLTHKLKSGVEALITSVPVYRSGSDTKPLCYIANFREITDLDNLKRELQETKSKTQSFFSELTELRNRLLKADQVIARSATMRNIMEKLLKISPADVNVYIHGESGVGKEVVAMLIHKMSHRKDGPFIQINCGAIPENLLESEMFGYEKGAFTGANSMGKPGILETAQRGTVLLDEIGDLPLTLQVKLLRSIQNREFYRVGGISPVKLDTRIICATNKDLGEMVKRGLFREDLFYRINVIPVFIPALRERREDILPLAHHFLHRFNQKYSYDRTLSPEVCKALEQYGWPGNVRELENIIERLVIMSEERQICSRNLPDYILYTLKSGKGPLEIKPLKEAVARLENRLISEAIESCGSLRKAAERLGVDHSTLVKKQKKFRHCTR
jgi:transcriptional regulator with PAS, ATPase and Fis domain